MARWLVPVCSARAICRLSNVLRAASCGAIATFAVVFGASSLQNATANGDTRTISFHHIHLKEDTTITYKVNGRYDPAALQKVNYALRDWRTGEPTTMDPQLIDILWEVHRAVGSQEPIHVIGGFRSPATNAMLRRRSSGVARHSQHMNGKAIDFFIPDVELSAVREAGLRLQRGGVGFYPTSGAPFVHLDTGSVRHWPRMPEGQLARVLAKGPLVAANTPVQKKARPIVVASRPTQDDEEEVRTTPTPRARPAAVVARAETPVVVAAAVPVPKARPAVAQEPTPSAALGGGFNLASAETRIVRMPPRPAQATSLVPQSSGQPAISANDIINERGYWQGLAEQPDRPTPPANIPEERTASTEPVLTGSVARGSVAPWALPDRRPSGDAMAYAPANEAVDARAAPKAKVIARAPASRDTTVAVKETRQVAVPQAAAPVASVRIGDRLNDPWMRAMMIAPNAQAFMNTSLYGATDFGSLRSQLRRPTTSVMMTFSDDPYLGMSFERFQGNAVVFVSTVTFAQRTAALR
jgi:uncharacterized protein YcbK (DUF882 family)